MSVSVRGVLVAPVEVGWGLLLALVLWLSSASRSLGSSDAAAVAVLLGSTGSVRPTSKSDWPSGISSPTCQSPGVGRRRARAAGRPACVSGAGARPRRRATCPRGSRRRPASQARPRAGCRRLGLAARAPARARSRRRRATCLRGSACRPCGRSASRLGRGLGLVLELGLLLDRGVEERRAVAEQEPAGLGLGILRRLDLGLGLDGLGSWPGRRRASGASSKRSWPSSAAGRVSTTDSRRSRARPAWRRPACQRRVRHPRRPASWWPRRP